MQHFQDFELKNYTSFKIGGRGKNVYFPEAIDEFAELLKTLENPLVLGGMSNVLVSSMGVNQNLILTKKLNNFSINGNIIEAQAGAIGPLVAKYSAEAGLSGMEFMCGFPGTIGGMVYMNASAHKQSVADIFKSAVVYDKKEKATKTLTKEEMNFDYRSSVLQKGQYILLEAEFELNKGDKETVLAQMQANKDFRAERQPNLSKPNCGSVFKNPENASAGRLLDDAGAKTLSEGGAKVFENHANFIINTNVANSEDVSKLIKKMYDKVREKFDIKLQPEVVFIGEMNEVEKEIWNELLSR